MKYGLTEDTIQKIQEVFATFPLIEKAVIFGSRVKGNYKKGSDIDLTLHGAELTTKLLRKIENELDDLLLPYKIDLSVFHLISNPDFIEHILRVGQVFYEKRGDFGKDSGDGMKKLQVEGWKVEKLGDVCEVIGGGTPSKTNKKFYNGSIHWATVRDMKFDVIEDTEHKITEEAVKKSSTNIIPKNNVVIATRVGLGKVCILKHDTAINQDLRGIIPHDSSQLLPRFLFLWFKSVADLITKEGTGATVQGVKLPFIKSLEIPIPPLPEQQRIVSLLDETFAGLAQVHANAERNLVNAREVFESYLKEVFENKHGGWEESSLGDIGKICMCKRIFKEQTTTTGDIPFYKIGTFGKEPDAYISKEIYDEFRENYSFPNKGDILISASGTIGRRVKYDGKPAYFQDSNIVWVENDETQVLNDYLYHFYGACNWNSTKGATIARLYTTNLKELEIAFPKSLEEQRAIVERLDALAAETSRLEAVYQSKLEAVEELRKSVLQKAFEGGL